MIYYTTLLYIYILFLGDDGKISMWTLEKGDLVNVYSGHFSKVTSVTFHCDNKHFISSGRDKVVMLWNMQQTSALKIVPMFEAVETIVSLPLKFKLPNTKISSKDGGIYVATGGERGVIRVWDLTKSREVYVQENSLVSKAKEEGIFRSYFHLMVNMHFRCRWSVNSETTLQ